MTDSRPVTVSIIQTLAIDDDVEGNRARMRRHLSVAGARGSRLAVLPEVWTGTGFSRDGAHRTIAEPIPGPSTDMLCEAAARHSMAIVGSQYEIADDGRLYNTAPVIGPDGRLMGRYRKTHLFDVPNRADLPAGVVESEKVDPGDGLQVYDLGFARMGVAICSDLRFPEIFRTLAVAGAELIALPTAFLSPRLDHWEFLLRARATDNQLFMAGSSMTGREPVSGTAFLGRGMLVDPWGVVLATVPDMETCTTMEIDLAMVEKVRRWWPMLDQRRPDLYARDVERIVAGETKTAPKRTGTQG